MKQDNRYKAEFKARRAGECETIMVISDDDEEQLVVRSIDLLELVFTNSLCHIVDSFTGKTLKKLQRAPIE